ncbi:NAD(+)/NADH kinase [Treponema sp.]|uniref:NAD(+)/NADH kinase n=1 Tax=Treponema sp. TaxID=166 RepID=UPI0025E03742|nr:NAD(+)/NADH kinase [Treponema sp.]MCR5219104.1 NAD(+)/NADH kinase [Treponema sp.]
MEKSLILVNTFKKDADRIAGDIKTYLESKGLKADLYAYDGKDAHTRNLPVDFSGYDFAVTLGGDGTVLFAARECALYGIPVFPVNLGEFGFLAGVQKDMWQKELEEYLSGKSLISERNLLESEVLRGGRSVFKSRCMNDTVISGTTASGLVNLEVAYNRALLGSFKSTGVIVSTATGSTAYSAAAGGPIVEPSLNAVVLTPISSFSLSARPLVLGPEGEIAMRVLPSRVDIVLVADGQIDFPLQTGDVIISGISKYKARIIGSTQEKFYSALQSKLNWSGGPRA